MGYHARRNTILLTVALAVAAIGQGRSAIAQAPLRTLTMGLGGTTANEWPQFVSEDMGFFAANGLKVDLIAGGNAAALSIQLVTGALDIADISAPQLIQAIDGGAQIIAFADHSHKPPYLLIGRKGMTSTSQLKGKTIIVGGPTDNTRMFTDKILAANRLTPDDYSYSYSAASGERFAALVSGAVDAALLAAPFSFRAASQGYPILDATTKYYPSFLLTAFVARTDWARDHGDLLIAFTKGYLQGVRWLYDPANKARAIQILSQRTNTTIEDATATYEMYVTKLREYTPNGVVTNESLAAVLDALLKVGQIKAPHPPPAKYYDNRWVEAAQLH